MNRIKFIISIMTAVVLLVTACQASPSVSTAVFVQSDDLTAGTPTVALPEPSITFPPTNPLPTLTPSITTTAFPSITPLPTATDTFTPTPIGFIASDTPEPPTQVIIPTTEVPDLAEGATDDWGSATRCSLISKNPENWTLLKPKSQIKVSWTLMNTGIKTWQSQQMFVTYLDGARLSKTENISLVRDVRVRQTISPALIIVAPKLPGHYRSVWGIRLTSGRIFCTFTIKITVQ